MAADGYRGDRPAAGPVRTVADDAALAAAAARSWRTAAAFARSAPVRHARALFSDATGAGRARADPAEAEERAVAAAQALLADDGWAAAMLAPLLRRLARDPLFEPPLRVSRDPLRTGAVLFDGPAAGITASVLSADALRTLPAPATVVAGGRIAVTRTVRAGGAVVERWDAGFAADPFRAVKAAPARRLADLRPADGDVRVVDGRREAQLVRSADADVVTVTAVIRIGAGGVQRAYDRADGAFRRAGHGDEADSRTRLLLTLLRLDGRADAGGCFEAATRAETFDLRWAAMREWLATDAPAAQVRLAEMAADPHPEVAAAARAAAPLVAARLAERRAA